MSSNTTQTDMSSTESSEILLNALHNAMQTNVKINQDTLAGPEPPSQKQSSETQPKKVPPTAPPPIMDPLPTRRTTRAMSMIVPQASRPSDFGLSVPGQKDGKQVAYNAKEEFMKLVGTESSSFPRSSIQLEETSTILHPSQFKQIVAFDSTYASGMDQRGRPRRHTISGAAMSRRVPSLYREVLVQKSQQVKPTPSTTSPSLPTQPTAPQTNTSNDPSKIVDSSLNAILSPADGPKPTAPRRRRPLQIGGEEEESEEEEETEEDKAETGGDSTVQDEALHVYGLQYDGGLIDFVDHPTTSASTSTQPTHPPPAESSQEHSDDTGEQTPAIKSDDVLEMERVMSPHLSS